MSALINNFFRLLSLSFICPQRPCTSCQFYSLVVTCQQVPTNFSISSSYNKSVKIRLVATSHLQTSYNLLIQLAASLWMSIFDNQLATSLLTTCNRLVVNKLSQAMRTHPDIALLITSPFQDASTDLLQIALFWLYKVSSSVYFSTIIIFLFSRSFELAYGEGEYLSAVRSIRVLRPLRAINRVPSMLFHFIV